MDNKIIKTDKQQLNKLSKEDLVSLCGSLTKQLDDTNLLLSKLYEQIRLSNHKKYGPSSEKITLIGCEQIPVESLLGEEENTVEKNEMVTIQEPDLEEVIDVKQYRRAKKKGKREEELKDLPTEIIEYKINDEDASCKEVGCGGKLKIVSKESYKSLKYIPAQFVVEEHVTYVYSCGICSAMVRGEKPNRLLKGSVATPSLVASIMHSKYTNSMPLSRQSQEFARHGVNIPRENMANWVIRCCEEYLSILYENLKKELLKSPTIQADETRVRVLKEPDRDASTESWMWAYRTGEFITDKPVILFEYQKTRGSEHPINFLKTFVGDLTTDGLSSYKKLPPIVKLSGCWAHLRRKIFDSIKSLTKKEQKGTLAYEGLQRIGALYKIEESLKNKTVEQRLEERQIQSKPIVESFFKWIESLSESTCQTLYLGKAVTYAINQKEYLYRFLSNGAIPIDNNAMERSMKLFAVGRGNWLFCDTQKGATASAIVYSLIETAKANNLNPFNYLKHLLEVIPKNYLGTNYGFIEDLLPWSDKIPEDCKIK